jgi:hypothetical protein
MEIFAAYDWKPFQSCSNYKNLYFKNPDFFLAFLKMSYLKYQKITPKKGTFGAKIDL